MLNVIKIFILLLIGVFAVLFWKPFVWLLILGVLFSIFYFASRDTFIKIPFGYLLSLELLALGLAPILLAEFGTQMLSYIATIVAFSTTLFWLSREISFFNVITWGIAVLFVFIWREFPIVWEVYSYLAIGLVALASGLPFWIFGEDVARSEDGLSLRETIESICWITVFIIGFSVLAWTIMGSAIWMLWFILYAVLAFAFGLFWGYTKTWRLRCYSVYQEIRESVFDIFN